MTGSGLSVLLIDRLAEVLTVVGAVAVLGVVGSAVAELAVAAVERTSVCQSLTVTVCGMSLALVTPRLARGQVTVVVPVQVQPVPVADTRVVPVGSGSETETELATEGPALLPGSILFPYTTLFRSSGLSVLLIDRLAEVLTVVGAVAVLGVVGSAVAELAV